MSSWHQTEITCSLRGEVGLRYDHRLADDFAASHQSRHWLEAIEKNRDLIDFSAFHESAHNGRSQQCLLSRRHDQNDMPRRRDDSDSGRDNLRPHLRADSGVDSSVQRYDIVANNERELGIQRENSDRHGPEIIADRPL